MNILIFTYLLSVQSHVLYNKTVMQELKKPCEKNFSVSSSFQLNSSQFPDKNKPLDSKLFRFPWCKLKLSWYPALHSSIRVCEWLTLNDRTQQSFPISSPQLLSGAAGFKFVYKQITSEYICSDTSNKWFWIRMHYGIIFSCVETSKANRGLFFIWLFMKSNTAGGQDLLPWPDCRLRQMPIFLSYIFCIGRGCS